MNITNEAVSAYLNTLYSPVRGALETVRLRAEATNVPVIARDTEMFLRNILRIQKPKNILEIGTAVGYSAACFAVCTKCESIVSIEIKEEMYRQALENLAQMGLTAQISLFLGDAEKVILEDLRGRQFDFVFIDAGKSHYRRFFDAARTVCAKDAVIISDNVLLSGMVAFDTWPHRDRTSMRNMRAYIDYISSLEDATTSLIPTGDGIALTVLEDNVSN